MPENEDRPRSDLQLVQPEWHSRGYIPHWEAGETSQSITFRLHDSLPGCLLAQWEDELARLGENQQELERRGRIAAALDRGLGACWLKEPSVAGVVERALLHFDGTRYRLHAWVIMPNHVHSLVSLNDCETLSAVVHSWKSYTAKAANRLIGRSGAFWQTEYYDRKIRDERHFETAVAYIESNPVRAGLCSSTTEWRFGSARRRRVVEHGGGRV
jgi:putative DNA methylase